MTTTDVHRVVQDAARRIIIEDLVKDGITLEDAEWIVEQVEKLSPEERERIVA